MDTENGIRRKLDWDVKIFKYRISVSTARLCIQLIVDVQTAKSSSRRKVCSTNLHSLSAIHANSVLGGNSPCPFQKAKIMSDRVLA